MRLPVTRPPPPEGQRPKDAKEFPSFYQALPAGERPIDVARGTPVTAPPQARRRRPCRARPPPPTTLAPTRTTDDAVRDRRPIAADADRVPTTTTLPARDGARRDASSPRTHVARRGADDRRRAARRRRRPRRSCRASASHGGFTVEASPTRSRSEAEQLLGDAPSAGLRRDHRAGRARRRHLVPAARRPLRDGGAGRPRPCAGCGTSKA